MTALAGPRNTVKLGPGEVILTTIDVPLKAGTKAYQGGILCVDSTGFGVKATTAVGIVAVGMLDPEKAAQPNLDNTNGASGDIIARVAQGVFRFANLAADPITQADAFNGIAFLVDDQTVARSDGGGTRSPAGAIVGVDGTASVLVSIVGQLAKMVETAAGSGSAPAEIGVLSGPISVTKRSTSLAVSGTVAYTLADGTRVGQRKTLTADSAAATPHGVVTPAHGYGWTSADFTTARGSLELEWTVGGWRIVFVGGTVAIT
jgi:hypothetical protein